jgi:hypothetical protein
VACGVGGADLAATVSDGEKVRRTSSSGPGSSSSREEGSVALSAAQCVGRTRSWRDHPHRNRAAVTSEPVPTPAKLRAAQQELQPLSAARSRPRSGRGWSRYRQARGAERHSARCAGASVFRRLTVKHKARGGPPARRRRR